MPGEARALLGVLARCTDLNVGVQPLGFTVRHRTGYRVVHISDTMGRMTVIGRESEDAQRPAFFAYTYASPTEERLWTTEGNDALHTGTFNECAFWNLLIAWLKPEPIIYS